MNNRGFIFKIDHEMNSNAGLEVQAVHKVGCICFSPRLYMCLCYLNDSSDTNSCPVQRYIGARITRHFGPCTVTKGIRLLKVLSLTVCSCSSCLSGVEVIFFCLVATLES